MNNKRQLRANYLFPSQTKQELCTEELLSTIKAFMSQNKLTLADLHILNKIIRQLNMQNKDISNKVLRSLQKRFENVKNQYTR